MSIPVTRTKIILPRRRPDLLTRQRLLDLLGELLDNKLTILTAPAGSGKTSLLVDMAHQSNMPVCWYALDPLDREFKRFIAHLISSINQVFPEFGKQSNIALQNLSEADIDMDRLVTTLVNEAYDCINQHFLIILDDYHFLGDQEEINNFLSRFLQDADDNCHVVIASRTLLTIPDLALMVARSQVGGLGFDELAFKAEEIRALLQQNYHVPVSENAAEEMARESEGWITGLLLSTQTMWQGMTDRMRVARVSAVGLYDYLAQQVLDQQSPVIRDFLLRTSLLEEFDEELCEAVLGPAQYPTGESWGDLIEAVLRGNLFIMPVGDKGLWIRYHHLFRDFLQSRLAKESPEEEKRILQSLADVYGRRGEWEKAHSLYQRLGNTVDLIEIVERAGQPLIEDGRLEALKNWIDALPSDEIGSRPVLLSLRGTVALMHGEVERGLTLLNHSEKALRDNRDLPSLAITLLRRSNAYRFLGNYQESLKDIDEVVQLSKEAEKLRPLYAEGLRLRGLCLRQLGQSGNAIEYLKNSVGIYDSLGDAESVALVSNDLGGILYTLGNYQQARHYFEQALKHWQKTGNLTRQASVLNNLGVLYHELGDYTHAINSLEKALASANQSEYKRLQSFTLSSIGDLYQDLEAPDAASDAYRRANEISQFTDDRFLNFYTTQAEIMPARQRGEGIKAKELLAKALQLAKESDSTYEESLCKVQAGRLALADNNRHKAIENFLAAVDGFGLSGQKAEKARSCLYLAYSYYADGDELNAFRALEQAFKLADALENNHTLVVAGREVKSLLEQALKQSDLNHQTGQLLNQINRFEAEIVALRRHLRRQVSVVPFAQPRLTIRALGRVQVLVDGKPVPTSAWQAQAARDLFFLLLANSEGMTKEAIGAIFWPDSSPSQLKLQFKNSIYRLRHALELDAI
ncbi:MAG: tetratricopeptide repeat protein, partial [Chloroflexi bacterium]|nr:tetratricopeptide repeat protein [Chloroflexota bacterium]